MGLYKRGTIWWLDYVVAGKQHCESSHSTNKRVAQKLLSIRQAEVTEGRLRLVRSNPPRLEEWAAAFLNSIQHPNTKRTYTSCVESLKAFFATARLSEVTPERIEAFKEARLQEGVGPATINRNLAVLRRMLKLAARRRLIAQSPFNEVEFLEERSRRRQPHILTFQEERRLLAVASSLLSTLIVLLTETGLRVGREALPLKWEDVDFAAKQIAVRQSKTAAGRRVVPISERCGAALRAWWKLMGPEFSGYVFPNPSNPERHLKGVRKPWVSALKAAEIAYFPVYNLRATFASRLSAAGVPDNFVAQMLGHSTASILQTYTKAVDEYRREAIRKLENYRESARKQSAAAPPTGMIQ